MPPPTVTSSPSDYANTRALFIALSMLTDLALLVAGRKVASLHQGTLRAFAIINLSLLAVDLILTLGPIKRSYHQGFCLGVCAILEAFAAVLWIQFTSLLSSYFIFFLFFLVGSYRVAGYRFSLIALASTELFYLGAFLLERYGVIPNSPLLGASPSALDAAPSLAVIIFCSVELTNACVFAACNLLAWLLEEKDIALRAAREELRRALAEGRPGELIGRTISSQYLLSDFLGRGGMGDVYKATRESDGREVAIKILHVHLGAEPTAVGRFRREVEAARRLVGARVPEVLDSGTTEEGLHFIAMEWLRGEDLAMLLRRRERLPLEEVQWIADELAEVLDDAHASGVIHRDVKPQNVFVVEALDGSRRIHLLDFGIASVVDSKARATLTRTREMLGTPGYLAPEQIASSYGTVGPPTDVFAMGAVLYRALAGRPAFHATTEHGAVYAALNNVPPPPSHYVPGLPTDVDLVFLVALAKKSRDRYSAASEFAKALRRAAGSGLAESARARARALVAYEAAPTATQRIDDLEV